MNRHRGGWLLWAALLVAGESATLALIRAGNLIGYQHYLDVRRLAHTAPRWALLVFTLELFAALLLLWQRREFIGRTLRAAGWWRLGLVTAGMVLTSATLSRDLVQFVGELAFASLVQLVHLGVVCGLALSLDSNALLRLGATIDKLLGTAGDTPEPGGIDRFTWTIAAGVTVVTAVLALLVYQGHPHIPDEVAYLLQASYFAAGKLSLPLPAVPEAFDVDLMIYQATRWYSCMPPGWPAILSLGVLLGVPWLLNPILAGLNVLLASVLLRDFYSRRTARLGVILFATSPWALFMAMNLMNHTATLTATLLAAVAVSRMRRGGSLWWAALAGVGIGIVGLIRPLDGLAVAALLGIWSLGASNRLFRFAPSAVMTLSAILTGALTLPYNRHLTGSATTFPVMSYFTELYGPGANALGFGADRGFNWRGLDPLMGHGPIDVAINADFNLFQTNTELFGWATGSLLLVLGFLAWGRLRRADWMMLAAIVLMIAVQSIYWFSGGPDFGARYWFLIILPCVALAARSLEEFGARARNVDESFGAPRLFAGVGALIAVALLVFVPWRSADKYFHYRRMQPDIRALVAKAEFRDAMILIRGKRHPDYASAVVYGTQDPSSHQPPVVWDRADSTRAALARAYPARRFWVIDGPTVSGDGYRVLAGPLTASELLARRDPPAASPLRAEAEAP